MIIRHIPMKSVRRSSFSGLVKYIMDGQNKQERVGKITISNCNSIDPSWAVHEVLATQAKNQRAKGDKTYHMLISFAPGENPSANALREIEERLVSSVGFKEHQRISAVHHDTDNLHIHVAINKINPKTFNMIEPYRAYKVFAEVASVLEIEYGLEITNHQSRKRRSENMADDMEQHSGIESLINWMKRHCKVQIESANSWTEIHEILAQHGLKMGVRANGLVFCNDKGLIVKASTVSRNFSKKNLESRLGDFIPSLLNNETYTQNIYRYEPLNKKVLGSGIYARYSYERQHNKTILSEKIKLLRTAKSRLIEKAKKRGRIKRAALKLMKMPKTEKRILYQQINNTLLKDIAQIRKNYSKAHKNLMDELKNKTWADWLRQKAENGDEAALIAVRYRNRKNKSSYSYTLSGVGSNICLVDRIDSITKEGTEMPITFADSDMEDLSKKLILNQEKHHEQSRQSGLNARRRASRSNEIVRAVTDERRVLKRTKPNAFSIRQGPPAEGQNSLRVLSKLDVVQLIGRSKMLLQDNAYDQLERQRSQPDQYVRRSIFKLGSHTRGSREH